MIRILLIDDHYLFAEGMSTMLRHAEDIQVVGICTTAATVLDTIRATLPDVILLDINLGETSGLTLCRSILYHYPHSRVVTLTMYHESRYQLAMQEAGAKGHLTKSSDHTEVIQVIRRVQAGETYFPVKPDVFDSSETSTPKVTQISADLHYREKQILDGVLVGKTSRQIAEDLNISVKTVEFYRSSLLIKYDVRSTIELINKVRLQL